MMRTISIPLDPLLTPQQNAAKYYKRYAKAKSAEHHLQEQMEIARRDIAYMESVLEAIQHAETEQDFLDIRAELREGGFLKKQGKKEIRRAARPRQFRTSSGFRVLVGRNNRQNDQLTMKEADYRDIWLHTQKIHGSHVSLVILMCWQQIGYMMIIYIAGLQSIPDTLVEAAKIAAYYSQARESGNVPVDYTQVRYVKKPAGARPGMVTYQAYQTVYVTPEEALIQRLKES